MARHGYPPLDNLPPGLAREIASRVAPGRGNVWSMLCWSPNTAERFIAYSEAIRNENEIPPKIRELMILRVGHLCKAPYEVHHHERIGRSIGLSDAEIEAAATGPKATGLDDDQRLVLTIVDELSAKKQLKPATFKNAVKAYGARTVTDMVLLVGFYTMASMFLNSFEVDIEQPQTSS